MCCPVHHYFPWVSSASKGVDTHVLSLSPEFVQSGGTLSSAQWVLVGVADSSQLGRPERIKDLEKLKQMKLDHGMTTSAIYSMDNHEPLIG